MKRVRRTIFAAAISLASASCYIAIAPEGAPCDPSAPTCPAGQSCVLSTGGYVCSTGDGIRVDGGSGSSDADPNALDDDGDGIANATDNCRTLANANQANEDADTFGDACDLCPPATDNTDGDGDGVGDACDPNPTVGGDRIVVFESFDSGIPAGWTANGNYTTSGGRLISTVTDGNQNTLVMDAMTSARQTMYAQMTLTGVVSGQSGGALGIVDRFDANASVGVMCGGARGNGGFLAIVNAANGLAIQAAPHAFNIGTTFSLRFTRNDNNYACTDMAVSQTINAGTSPNGTFVGMRNRVISASYDWFMLVHSP